MLILPVKARIDLYYDLPYLPDYVIQVGEQFGGPAHRLAVKSRFAGAGPYFFDF